MGFGVFPYWIDLIIDVDHTPPHRLFQPFTAYKRSFAVENEWAVNNQHPQVMDCD